MGGSGGGGGGGRVGGGRGGRSGRGGEEVRGEAEIMAERNKYRRKEGRERVPARGARGVMESWGDRKGMRVCVGGGGYMEGTSCQC